MAGIPVGRGRLIPLAGTYPRTGNTPSNLRFPSRQNDVGGWACGWRAAWTMSRSWSGRSRRS